MVTLMFAALHIQYSGLRNTALSTKIHWGNPVSEQLLRECVIHLSVQHFWSSNGGKKKKTI